MTITNVTCLAVLIATAALSGCVTTPRDLAGNPNAIRVSINVAATAPTAFRRLTDEARECFSLHSMRVEADWFSDTGTGKVTALASTSLITTTFWIAEIQASADGSTRVAYTSQRGFASFASTIEAWMDGRPGDCPRSGYRASP